MVRVPEYKQEYRDRSGLRNDPAVHPRLDAATSTGDVRVGAATHYPTGTKFAKDIPVHFNVAKELDRIVSYTTTNAIQQQRTTPTEKEMHVEMHIISHAAGTT